MSTPPSPPPATPATPPVPAPSGPATPASAAAKPAAPLPKPPPEPLTGFRSALEHTGIPRSVLTWKPRLPSRNWTIFFTVVGTISYLYYDDRKQCDRIKQEYIDRVKSRAQEPTSGSMDVIRKVKVMGALWPSDEDDDRALRHFRKYVKPYLVAAAVDYEQVPAPMHGSITRQVHAAIVKKRRQALGLEQAPPVLSLPGVLNPQQMAQRELEGGTVLVGRATVKEYMEGLRRGWLGGVDEWDWEKDIERKLVNDGVFDLPKPSSENDLSLSDLESTDPTAWSDHLNPGSSSTTPRPAQSPLAGSLSFLSRPKTPTGLQQPQIASDGTTIIPDGYHVPPSPLPPQPPVVLVPFVKHLGFKQVPFMIYDFFTERFRVKAGAEAAMAIIEGEIRPLTKETVTAFNVDSEDWYKKSFFKLPETIGETKAEYYKKLATRLQDVRDLQDGKRELSEEEKVSTKPLTTEDDLKKERQKKELRWMGTLEGHQIVKPETEVAWDERFDGWLNVFTFNKDGTDEERKW